MTKAQCGAFRAILEAMADIERRMTMGMPYSDAQAGLGDLTERLIGLRFELMQSTQSVLDMKRRLFYHRHEPEGERDKDE